MSDLYGSLKSENSPSVPNDIPIYDLLLYRYIYDRKTGKLYEVVGAAAAGQAS